MSDWTGLCIMTFLPPNLARKLYMEGGEDQRDLHITWAFLGDSSDYTSEQIDLLYTVVEECAKYIPPIRVRIASTDTFAPTDSSEGKVPYFAAVESEQLMQWRDFLCTVLDTFGLPYSKTFDYHPHITLAYLDEHAPVPAPHFEPQTLTLESVTLSAGNMRFGFVLTGK